MNQDKVLTILVTLLEVNQIYLAHLIESDILKHALKQRFNQYLKYGEQFRKEVVKLIEIKHGENGSELNEQDADNFFELISAFYDLDENQSLKAIATTKNLINGNKKTSTSN